MTFGGNICHLPAWEHLRLSGHRLLTYKIRELMIVRSLSILKCYDSVKLRTFDLKVGSKTFWVCA